MAKARKPTYTKKDIVARLSILTGEGKRVSAVWVDHLFAVLRETMCPPTRNSASRSVILASSR